MAVAQATTREDLAFDGNLQRSDRSLRMAILIIILFSIALQLGMKTVPGFAVALVAVVLLGRIAVRGVRAFTEPVRLTIHQRGIDLRRSNGLRLWAEWRLFEGARIERLPSIASHVLNDRWRLTLQNAFKPSIGSFVDSKAMDRTIFYFPVLIDFEASPELVDQIESTMQQSITIAAREKKAKPVRKLPVQILDPLVLRECIVCEYPLEGLARSGFCPECGWRFEEKMFVLNGRSQGGFSLIAMGVMTVSTLILLSCMASIFFPTPQYMIIGLPLVIGGYAWWLISILTRGRGKVLATADGFELWRNGMAFKHISWRHVHELRQARLDQGMRLSIWTSQKWRIWYSSLLGTWRSIPPGRPEIDVIIDGSFDISQQIVRELQNRWHNADPHNRSRLSIEEAELAIGKAARW